ncbi:MAG: BatA and WFA domain-containing protein [Haliscomenobacter sp.]|nr:BatA and WFA domain-containing protein [Haliscomenobacter sp.]MBP9873510.1 BatA and WFA domain-containing protein [Haliscomenobacter sp.]
MQFLYPLFLVGALSLAIPVILHLFYFRRFKKVYFTNVRFLKEVKEETSSRSRLRNLLVLLMRLLVFLFLVLAFAQPFIQRGEAVKKGIKAVSVYVDNSFSMSALSQDVPLLEQAKARAREIVKSYNTEDRFQVISNEFSGRQQRLVSQEDALAAIEEIRLAPDARNLSAVLERQKQALSLGKTDNLVAYQLSDFQKSACDIAQYADSTVELNLMPLQAVRERNISIDSVWFEAPVQMLNQTNPLFIRLRNHSDELAENIRLSIQFEGQTKPVGEFAIPSRSTVTDTFNLTLLRTGWREAKLSLTDYPVQFDDHYFFSFQVAEKVRVLTIYEGNTNRYLDAALRGLPLFESAQQPVQGLDYSKFSSHQLIVLNDVATISSGLISELLRYADQGGNVLVFPNRNLSLANLREFMKAFSANEPQEFEQRPRQVSEVNTEEFIFKDVFENKSANLRLPSVQGSFRFSRGTGQQGEPLLSFRDGGPYLTKFKTGKGRLYVCASPLAEEYNNLVSNGEVFIPMLYKMAISAGNDLRIAYTIGRDELLEARHQGGGAEMVYKMKGQEEEFIPEQRVVGNSVYLDVNGQVREAGHYQLFLQPGETVQEFSFNYDRKESQLEYFDAEGLEKFAGPLANVITATDEAVLAAKIEEQSRGMVLWRWCIILALLFLAAEVFILRLWKV